MSLKKKYLKKGICKVTFRLPKEVVPSASAVSLVGDFNGWDAEACAMKKLKDGSFTVTVDLERGQEYQFRYCIDQDKWENDWEADKYVPNEFGDADNSVVVIT
jgi:1,4-alpha-glucan branching enzyme